MYSLFRKLEVTTILLTIAMSTSSCRASEQGSSATREQTDGRIGSLSGTVSDHLGIAVANAPIQAKNKTTGMVAARALSSADGRYTFALAPGTYELSVSMPCCAFKPFLKGDVTMDNAQNVQLDIRLEEGASLSTVGDDPGTLAAIVRKRSVVPPGPAPRTPEGKPDLSGLWRRSHPADPNPTWVGHSIGKWEGNTLIIDTVGFNDRGWMDIYPRTEKLHIIERYSRPDVGHLDVEVSVDDQGVFQKPWKMIMKWDLAPQEDLLEYVCENNKFLENISFAAEFDANKPVKLTGKVTKVEWTNPHAYIYIDVKDEKTGRVTNWAFEMGSPNGLMRLGWTRNLVTIDDVVTKEVWPNIRRT